MQSQHYNQQNKFNNRISDTLINLPLILLDCAVKIDNCFI